MWRWVQLSVEVGTVECGGGSGGGGVKCGGGSG